jgi:hypothetical protein
MLAQGQLLALSQIAGNALNSDSGVLLGIAKQICAYFVTHHFLKFRNNFETNIFPQGELE